MGCKEYAVKSTFENNDDSKKHFVKTSDGENMSENSNEELQSVHDYEDPLAKQSA